MDAAMSGAANMSDREQWFFFCPCAEREAHGAVRVLEGHGVAVLGVLRVGQPGDRREADHGVLPGPRAHGHQDQVEDERVQGRRRRSSGRSRAAGSSQGKCYYGTRD
jgi:hypothetical protein